jgi:hypothetical protein
MSEEIEEHNTLPQSREEDAEKPMDMNESTMADANGDVEGMKDEEEGIMLSNEERGGPAVRPIFFGNLSHNCIAGDVEAIFERPVVDARGGEGGEFLMFVVAGCSVVCLLMLSDLSCWD